MPIYEYQCEQCGNRFEKFCRFGDEKTGKCPKCGAENPKRIISPVAKNSADSSCGTRNYG